MQTLSPMSYSPGLRFPYQILKNKVIFSVSYSLTAGEWNYPWDGITFTYDSNGNLIKQSNGLEFLYDHTGVFAVKHNGSTYFYRKDAQANIVALLDNTGAVVVKYKYDAWGNCKVLNASGVEIT